MRAYCKGVTLFLLFFTLKYARERNLLFWVECSIQQVLYQITNDHKTKKLSFRTAFYLKWKHTDSNRGPSACKADALNQLSYASVF